MDFLGADHLRVLFTGLQEAPHVVSARGCINASLRVMPVVCRALLLDMLPLWQCGTRNTFATPLHDPQLMMQISLMSRRVTGREPGQVRDAVLPREVRVQEIALIHSRPLENAFEFVCW